MIHFRNIGKTWVFSIMLWLLFSTTVFGQKTDSSTDGKGYFWTDIRDFGLQGKGWKHDDLGFYRQANAYQPLIESIIKATEDNLY